LCNGVIQSKRFESAATTIKSSNSFVKLKETKFGAHGPFVVDMVVD